MSGVSDVIFFLKEYIKVIIILFNAAILGQRKSLNCYNSEENKGNPEAEENDVRWIHNGQVV